MDQARESARVRSTAEQYATLPATLTVRELRYEVGIGSGFRTRTVTLVTDELLDAEAYPLTALAELYGARWRVELNLIGT